MNIHVGEFESPAPSGGIIHGFQPMDRAGVSAYPVHRWEFASEDLVLIV